MKPFIGITTNFIKDDQFGIAVQIGGLGQSWQALADDYIRAVFDAGGIPVILPVLPDSREAEAFISHLDGILFSGGCSLSPLNYNCDMIPQVGEICQERDTQEIALMQSALNVPGLPILGVCRGCQLLNVVLGGSLVPDIVTGINGNHFFADQRMNVPMHRIEIKDGSMLKNILNGENRVNSYHHQCIDRPGKNVEITARDRHGVPECIEVSTDRKFVLGVQWHPEGLAHDYEGHANIFREFIRAAEKQKEMRR